jgi:hypothetical protein
VLVLVAMVVVVVTKRDAVERAFTLNEDLGGVKGYSFFRAKRKMLASREF